MKPATLNNPLSAQDLSMHTIKIFDPFSEYLLGTADERRFSISLLDVVRFSGHACPSVTGAFLTAQLATQILFPQTRECVRGSLRVELPGHPGEGPVGPIANVLSYITGAWAETGFGGMKGNFVRKGLLHFGVKKVPSKSVRFCRLDDETTVDITYDPSRVPFEADPDMDFQLQWRHKIHEILRHPEVAVFRADTACR